MAVWLDGTAARRVCAAAIFREPRLRVRCRFCALFVLLFSFATTKMSGAVVIVHSTLVLYCRFERFLEAGSVAL